MTPLPADTPPLTPEQIEYFRRDIDQRMLTMLPGESLMPHQVGEIINSHERLRLALATCQQERDALEARFEGLDRLSKVKLVSAGAEGNEFALKLSSKLWPMIVNSLAVWFVEHGGKNYVEFKADYDPKDHTDEAWKKASLTATGPLPVGTFVITMQRLHGKSPNDLRLEAESELDKQRERAESAESALRRAEDEIATLRRQLDDARSVLNQIAQHQDDITAQKCLDSRIWPQLMAQARDLAAGERRS